jgi:hypothetical protein
MTQQFDTAKKWHTLIERLAFNTFKGKIDWDEGPYKESIVTSVGTTTITLRLEGNDFLVMITDSTGEVVDSFSDNDLTYFDSGQNAYAFINSLYRNAKRRISGADQVLDQLLADLPSDPDDEIPF